MSEEPDIRVFEPRPVPSPGTGVEGLAVWAVDEAHLPNYLLPRECPRVTFAAVARTTREDREKFGSDGSRVVAIESGWVSRIEACTLYLYEFDPADFTPVDLGAGYYIARVPVRPTSVLKQENLLAELSRRNVETRSLANLWDLRDAVSASSLEYSIIRFRNAVGRG